MESLAHFAYEMLWFCETEAVTPFWKLSTSASMYFRNLKTAIQDKVRTKSNHMNNVNTNMDTYAFIQRE